MFPTISVVSMSMERERTKGTAREEDLGGDRCSRETADTKLEWARLSAGRNSAGVLPQAKPKARLQEEAGAKCQSRKHNRNAHQRKQGRH